MLNLDNLDNFDTINVDLSAVKTSYCCGVTYPSPATGLSEQEIKDIAYRAGLSSKISSFGISEYNPAIEKFRTGTLVV